VVAIVPQDKVFEKMRGNLQEAKTRGAAIIVLSDAPLDAFEAFLEPNKDHLIPVPSTHPLLTPIPMVVPLQLLAYHIAVLRGCDVDQPRNLAKSVTVE
jgi:glucosamine--fructose-6-phosphate aminotransferase (isomerizing)